MINDYKITVHKLDKSPFTLTIAAQRKVDAIRVVQRREQISDKAMRDGVDTIDAKFITRRRFNTGELLLHQLTTLPLSLVDKRPGFGNMSAVFKGRTG